VIFHSVFKNRNRTSHSKVELMLITLKKRSKKPTTFLYGPLCDETNLSLFFFFLCKLFFPLFLQTPKINNKKKYVCTGFSSFFFLRYHVHSSVFSPSLLFLLLVCLNFFVKSHLKVIQSYKENFPFSLHLVNRKKKTFFLLHFFA
jgi:hypothetical protein